MGGVVPLPHQGVFEFLGFKISDLVRTFGEFDDVLPVRKEFLEFKICDLMHTLGKFVK